MKTILSRIYKVALMGILVGALALTFSHRAFAAPEATGYLTVNGVGDSNKADKVLTLREALLIAFDGTENTYGLGRPLTNAEFYQLSGCNVTGYEPDHWWITDGCGMNFSESIGFNLPNCPCTISPSSELPFVANDTTIDGYTQPGSAVNTSKNGMNAKILISLNGLSAGKNVSGLGIGSNVTLKGLRIYGFQQFGLDVQGSANHIEGNMVFANKANGIMLKMGNNVIGSNALAGRNQIFQNGWHGIEAFANAGINSISNNLIGVGFNGDTKMGNTFSGISIYSSLNDISQNTIAYNKDNGILVLSGTQNYFHKNSIFSNGKLGIDLGNDGVTQDDGNDSDTGANNLQNYPVLTKAKSVTKFVKGKLVSKPNTTFEINLYATASCDANGYGEGKTYLGYAVVNTDGAGVGKFTATLAKFNKGDAITAVAGSGEGTSEFSQCITAK